MLFTTENILLIGSIIMFVSIIVGRTGYKYGVPSLLLFLLVGMAFGSDGLGFQFHNAKIAQFIGMIALCIILFSGGMDTKIKDIKPVLKEGMLLSTAGVFITSFVTGFFIFWLSGQPWTNIHFALIPSLLLASVMSSTDSASVFAILRSEKIHLKHNLRPMLELESGSNDPMAYMLTMILIGVVQLGEANAGKIALNLFLQFAVGGIIGWGMGRLSIIALKRISIDLKAMYPIMLLTLVFFTFSITDLLGGNGYLAVYISGIIVGNNVIKYRKDINSFMSGLTWLFQIIMFLCLGLLVNPHEMIIVAPVAILVGAFMIIIGRPISVFLCLLPFGKKINFSSKLFVSWVGLRGAVPIIFATYPVVANVPGADQIFNIVFFITIISLIVQGTTIKPLSRQLDLALPYTETENSFGIDIPDEINSKLTEHIVTAEMIKSGAFLKDIKLPKEGLVMFVKRKKEHIIPNGSLELKIGDKLLIVSKNKELDK